MAEPQTEFDSLDAVSKGDVHRRWRGRFGCVAIAIALVVIPLLGGIWLYYHLTAPPPSTFYGSGHESTDFAIHLDADGSARIAVPWALPVDGTCPQASSTTSVSTEIDGHWRRTWPAIILVTGETGEKVSLMAHNYRGAPAWDSVTLEVCLPDGSIDTERLVSFENP